MKLRWIVALVPLLAGAQTGYSSEKERALGQQLSVDVERNAIVIGDAAITGYVDRIARKVAETAKLRTPLTIKVISGPDSYATTLPGGFVYVNTKLISEATNEAELAAVMAHQIGHLVLWPGKSSTPASDAIGTIPLVFLGGGSGLCVRGPAKSPVGLAMPVGYLASSRETEAKADELALAYMESAGYDPGALPDFYERIPKRKPGSASRVFDPGMTMPEATRTQAESMRNARIFVVNTSEFEETRRKVAALAPAQAAARANPPSRTNPPSLKKAPQ